MSLPKPINSELYGRFTISTNKMKYKIYNYIYKHEVQCC